MKRVCITIFIAFLALASLACNLGAPMPTPTRFPTATIAQPDQPPTSAPPTLQPTLAGGNLNGDSSLPSASDSSACPGAFPARLTVGVMGRVTPGLPNIMRSQPTKTNSASKVVGQIPAGATFMVQGGPACADGYVWWQVNYRSTVGWTPEGEGSTFWLEPVAAVNPTGSASDCPGTLPTRLNVGGSARVTAGPPNTLRQSPGKAGAKIGEIPAGGVFAVIGGPQCVDNIQWWQVTYNALTGWTGEGQASAYWLEPQ